MIRPALPCLGLALTLLAPGPTYAERSEQVLYSRHVQAVLSRLGCNGGTCHGAVKGQNGFKLSLFGAEPGLDLDRMVRDSAARRLNFADPANSLLLLKATNQLSHQGGKRTAIGSPEYEMLRRWIAAGAPADDMEASRVRALRVTPAERTARPGESYRLQVSATFADGSTEDVTSLCAFGSLEPRIATVDPTGAVQVRQAGVAALLVRYRAMPAVASVQVPRPGAEPFPDVAPLSFIDRHVLGRLRRLHVLPAPLADDAAFLRRASLDVTGALPAPEEVRAFLADSRPDKRARKIEELLARPAHAALWTLKFSDLLKGTDWGGFGYQISTIDDAPRFQAWIRARLKENLPYDQFVERILTATSREGRSLEEYAQELTAELEGFGPERVDLEIYQARKTLDLYWQRNSAHGVNGALQVAHAFLGLRLECAQCHRHPHDVWQQDDLLSFANFFMAVRPVGGNHDLLVKKYPETAALCKQYEAEAKKLGEQVKHRRDTEGKELESQARQARSELEQLVREIARLEADLRRLAEPVGKEPADPAKAASLRDQLAEKRRRWEACRAIISRQDLFQKEVSRLDRRSKAMGHVPGRLLHHELHVLTKDAPSASVSSTLGTQTSRQFRLLGEREPVEVPTGQDPRAVVMAWMRRPDNPYFARAIVNRVWAHYFGRGIVDPPDNLSPFNPATHPELLQDLADGFVQHHYDLRWLHRTILSSRTYQQASTPTRANESDQANYAYFRHRRLPAEVLLDALDQATGTREKMGMERYHWPAEWKAIDLPHAPKGPAGGDTPTNAFVFFMLETFGKPQRNAAVQCDCERDSSATMLQVLSLANHPRIWEKVTDPQGLAARVLKEHADDDQRIEELYLAALGRLPRVAERRLCRQYVAEAKTPLEGFQGVLWGLLNTREFLLQH